MEVCPVHGKSDLHVSILKLLPGFTEKDLDLFFSMFKRLAESRNWADEECVLVFHSVLTVRQLEACASVRSEELV